MNVDLTYAKEVLKGTHGARVPDSSDRVFIRTFRVPGTDPPVLKDMLGSIIEKFRAIKKSSKAGLRMCKHDVAPDAAERLVAAGIIQLDPSIEEAQFSDESLLANASLLENMRDQYDQELVEEQQERTCRPSSTSPVPRPTTKPVTREALLQFFKAPAMRAAMSELVCSNDYQHSAQSSNVSSTCDTVSIAELNGSLQTHLNTANVIAHSNTDSNSKKRSKPQLSATKSKKPKPAPSKKQKGKEVEQEVSEDEDEEEEEYDSPEAASDCPSAAVKALVPLYDAVTASKPPPSSVASLEHRFPDDLTEYETYEQRPSTRRAPVERVRN